MKIIKLGKLVGDWSIVNDTILQQVKNLFNLENCNINLNIQNSNDVLVLTTDNLENYNIEAPYTVKRIRIHLTDCQPGHFYCYDDEIHVNWRAGDVYTYDWNKTSYASANASHHPMMILELTGVVTEKTTDFINRLKRFDSLQLELSDNSW